MVKPSRPYQVTAAKFGEIQRVSSNRELFSNATDDVSMMVHPDTLKEAQRAEVGPKFAYLADPTTPSHYFERDDVLYLSYLPVYLRKRSTFCAELVIRYMK